MLIVEMHRIPKPADGYDLFDCPGPLWDSLRKLAVRYGWKPAGTLPASFHSAEKAKAEELKLAELLPGAGESPGLDGRKTHLGKQRG